MNKAELSYHRLRSHLNTNSSTPEWSLGDTSKINAYMSETETNITVNWSGGGFIKPGMCLA